MVATITSLVFDVTKTAKSGKDYTVHQITYQGEPYQGVSKPPTSRDIFTNSDVGKQLNEYKVGDVVDLVFEKDGRYSNLVGISQQGASQASTGATTSTGIAPTKAFSQAGEERDLKISRAVALKVASEQLAGSFAKTTKAGKMSEDITTFAEKLIPYLTLNEVDVTTLDQDIPD